MTSQVPQQTTAATPLLAVDGVTAGYGDVVVLDGLDLKMGANSCLAVLGPNGAGKTTLMRTIAGVISPTRGAVEFPDHGTWPRRPGGVISHIGWVPEGRLLFGDFPVLDNLMLSARAAGQAEDFQEQLEMCLELFPRLKERLRVRAGALSGGEQQMVAIARALVRRPRLLLLDEPSMGLAPLVMEDIREAVRALRAQQLSVLVTEQNVNWLEGLVDSVALLRHGQVEVTGTDALLRDRETLRQLYLEA